jgi:cytochrome c
MKAMYLLLAIAGAVVSGWVNAADSAADLLKSKGCLNCHATDQKKIGPAYKDVAAKYKDDKGAESKLVTALKEGKGHPVKIAASDAELKSLVQYVLSLK